MSRRHQQQTKQRKARDEQDGIEHNGDDDTADDSDSQMEVPDLTTLRATTQRSGVTSLSSVSPALHESIIAEEWVNVHLETSGMFLLPATDIHPLLHGTSATLGGSSGDALAEDEEAAFAFRTRGDSGPLGRAGIDRASLYRLGMPKDLVDRLYRALYVYTNGFHNLIAEIAAHCPPRVERHVSSNVWLTFLLLLEQCENGKYEMAMLKFKQATEVWRQQMQEEFVAETTRLEVQLQAVKASLADETARSTEKSGMIAQLAAEAASAHQTVGQSSWVSCNRTHCRADW